MTPVAQSETAPGRGDCLTACVATLLDLPLAEVPNFRLARDQWGALQEWLGGRGLFALRIPAANAPSIFRAPTAHCIVTGPSPRGSHALHAVVARWDGDKAVGVHDPHPDGGWLAGDAEWMTFIAKLT